MGHWLPRDWCTAAARAAIAKSGGINVVAAAMEAYSYDLDVQRHGCGVLRNLASGNAGACSEASSRRAQRCRPPRTPPPRLSLAYPERLASRVLLGVSPRVPRLDRGCGCYRARGGSDGRACNAPGGAGGSVRRSVQPDAARWCVAQSTDPIHDDTAACAAPHEVWSFNNVVALMGMAAGNRVRIAEAGGIERVVAAMASHVKHSGVQKHGCGALRSLASGNARTSRVGRGESCCVHVSPTGLCGAAETVGWVRCAA